MIEKSISYEQDKMQQSHKNETKCKSEAVENIDHCPECGSKNLIHDEESGEIVCGNCGLVVGEVAISERPEWTDEEGSESRSRVGTPISFSLHDKGLTTTIGREGKDTLGRELPLNTKLQMSRLRKWQGKSADRNLDQAMAELDRLADKLHIPESIKEKAAIVYRRALKKGLVRGRSIAAMTAAALYASCRMTQTPRTLKDISVHSPIDRKDIARYYRLVLRELNLRMPIPGAEERIPKIAAKVGIGEKTQQTAIEILRRAGKMTAGKDPMGLVAAALYIACVMNDEKRTLKMIADAAGVTEVTIKKRCEGLRENFPEDLNKKGIN
jgi:transcription initiation factor TFIIB